MADGSEDEVVRDLRARITELDDAIFDAVNRRLDLVARLKRHKEERGYGFVDPEREERMVAAQASRNRGPLSDEGLRRFYAQLLELVKRELG
ncbi:MAG TPA: chorismate mutase [Gaiellaceae bacterium]|nr:chorismate mutase [Gaiellaceae bacterium]